MCLEQRDLGRATADALQPRDAGFGDRRDLV
jgi:hypothetical protein